MTTQHYSSSDLDAYHKQCHLIVQHFFSVKPGSDGPISSLYPEWCEKHDAVLNKTRAFVQSLRMLSQFTSMWTQVEKCQHRFPDGTIPTDFHPENWLHFHQVLSCLKTIYESVNIHCDNRFPFIAAVATLFHDIGKPATRKEVTHTFPDGKVVCYTSFPGHGPVGAIIFHDLVKLLHDGQVPFSFYEIESIIQAIQYHMCGIHRSCPDHVTHGCCGILAATMAPLAKEILVYLNIGDSLSRPTDITTAIHYKQFHLKWWLPNMMKPTTVKEAFGFFAPKYEGIVFTVSGSSGVGKSTVAAMIQSIFGYGIRVFSRDHYTMCEVLKKVRDGYMTEKRIARLSARYDLDPAFVAGYAAAIVADSDLMMSGLYYKLSYAIYKEEKLAPLVNKMFKLAILKAIRQGVIPIIDTIANGTPGMKSMVPHDIARLLHIDIHCSASPFDIVSKENAQRRGMTPEEFMDIFRKGYFTNPATIGANTVLESSSHHPHFRKLYEFGYPLHRFILFFGDTNKKVLSDIQDLVYIVPMFKPFAPPPSKRTYDPNSIKLWLGGLYLRMEKSIENMADLLESYGYVLKPLGDSGLLKLGYRNGSANWRHTADWATRGVVFYFDKDGHYHYVKGGSPRSPEIQNHNTKDCETQELGKDLGSDFWYVQKVINGNIDDLTMNFKLTFKHDGSLFQTTVYHVGTAECQMVESYIMGLANSGDEWCRGTFAKYLWRKCEHLGLKWRLVLSSQNTLVVGTEDMFRWYFYSILLQNTVNVDKLTLADLDVKTDTELIDLAWPWFVLNILNFDDGVVVAYTLDAKKPRTYCFEAICPNQTAYGTTHNYLACSYSKASCAFLGLFAGTWYPHCDEVMQSVIATSDVIDPLFYKCANVREFNRLIERASQGDLCILGKPSNLRVVDLDQEDYHPELFVAYVNNENYTNLSIKVKGRIWYVLHKPENYWGRIDPISQRPYKDVIMEFDGWYLEAFPILQKLKEAERLINQTVPDLITFVRADYMAWLDTLEKTEESVPFIIAGKKKKQIFLRPGSPYQYPFIPIFLNRENTVLAMSRFVEHKSGGVIKGLGNDMKNTFLKNKSWLMTGIYDLSQLQLGSILDIAQTYM